MYGNGVGMGMEIMKNRSYRSSWIQIRHRIGCSVVVVGTTARGSRVCRSATGTTPPAATTALVFVFPGLNRSLDLLNKKKGLS